MTKRIFSALLALLMLASVFCVFTTAVSADGTDTAAADSEARRWATEKGVINPVTYFPSAIITTEEFLNALWLSLGKPAPSDNKPISPVTTGNYQEALIWASRDYIHNTPNTCFLPAAKKITRIQAIWMLYLEVKKPDFGSDVHYKDTYYTAYYIKALDWAFENGLTDREEGGYFSPHAYCTWAEAIGFLYRFSLLQAPSKTLGDFKWLAFGNSLTDMTGQCGRLAPNKYHQIIARETGMEVMAEALGGTGYWKNEENGICYYQRMQKLDPDPDVDIVTIFGSVNDWGYCFNLLSDEKYYRIPNIGYDRNGSMITFAWWHKNVRPYHILEEEALARLDLTDTRASNAADPLGVGYIAYVNETVNLAHEKFPNAKIVLVNELYYKGIRWDYVTNLSQLKQALVARRRELGDTWLSVYKINECTFEGLDVPERQYVNAIPGQGLNFSQLDDAGFKAYYTYDNNGHPNDLYHRIWLAPVYANLLCETLGVDPATLPETLRMD